MKLKKEYILDKLIINSKTQKCFIFDLDGTIIFNDKPLENNYEKLLKIIHDNNHKIVFASGRPIRDFPILMPNWTHEFNKALFGGGVSLIKNEIISKNIIPKSSVFELLDLCDKNQLPFIIDDHLNYYHPKSTSDLYSFIDNSVIARYQTNDLDKILENDIYKLFVLEDELIKIFSEYTGQNSLEIHHHTKFKSFDVLPQGVNKFNGVANLFSHHKNDVFVFGDDLNDYPLFMNFHNSILMGDNHLLDKIAKINIINDNMRYENLEYLINVILDE